MSRRSRRICSLLVLTPFLAVLAVAQSTQLIQWNADALLTWEDFQGVAPANAAQMSEAAAIYMTVKWHTSYSVRSQRASGYAWVGTVEDAIVSNLMNPRFSWVVPSKATPAVLRHEQFHFHLNEVYKRRLLETLGDLQIQGSTAEATMTALDERIQQTADGILDRLSAMQDLYDRETANGTDSDAQAQWESDIQVWLVTPALAP